MSTLLVNELYPGIVFPQLIRITRDVNVAAIRPWIYRHNDLLDGELQCRVYQGANQLTESILTAAEINQAFTENFAHGFLRFDFEALTLRVAEGNVSEEYRIEFEMVNHTLNSNNFIGIVRRWEAKTYPTYGSGVVNNEAQNDSVEPAGLELFEYTEL